MLGIINKRYPNVGKVVLTGSATESHRAACLADGAELFLEKPITPDGIKFVFNVLNDLLSWTQREGFSGTLKQVGLPDVIQIQCLGRNSCILEVRNQQTRGEIYIENGMVVHATAGGLAGEKAFHLLLTLNNGEFRSLQPLRAGQTTVMARGKCYLMESARRHDEQKGPPADDDTIILIPKPASATPKPAPVDENPPVPKPVPPAQTPLPPPPAAASPDTEFIALGDDIIVVSTYNTDGKWHPQDDPEIDPHSH